MDNIPTKISYSLKDRYLNLDKEKRIGKRQFQTRVFVPWILMIIPLMVVSGIITWILLSLKVNFLIAGLLMGLLPMILYYGISLFIFPTLIKKRAHDFWSSGIIETRLFIGGFIVFLVICALLLLQVFVLENEIFSIDILLQLRDYIRYAIIALWIYLMFRPGNKEVNEYGEPPTNVKIGFLG